MKNIKNIYLSLFVEFFKIGLFTIGGGVAMIPLIEEIAVNKKKWLTSNEMIECITLGQSLPGVIAINTSTYVGYKKAGILGAIFSTLGVIMPSFIIIILLAGIINKVDDIKFVKGMFTGIKACVTGIVFVVTLNLAKRLLTDKFSFIVAFIGFLSVVIFNVNAIFIVLIAGISGALYFAIEQKRFIGKINVEEDLKKNIDKKEGDIK